MEQLSLFSRGIVVGFPADDTHTEQERLEFEMLQYRQTQAAYGGNVKASGPVSVKKMNKKIVAAYEFLIEPNESFKKQINKNPGNPYDPEDQRYLTNLHMHSETVALKVRDFMDYAESQGPISALHLFTTATIYGLRLIVYFADGQPLENKSDIDEWLKSINAFFGGARSKFFVRLQTTLYTTFDN